MSVLVTKPAPDFTAAAVLEDGTIVENFNLKEYLNGSYGVVFFYPLDFTFVCPSEILAFDHRIDKFKELNTKVVGISIDSQFTHNAYRNTPVNEGGLGPVRFPLVADVGGSIMDAYGVRHPGNVALRATFLIDRDGIVRHEVVNDLPLGRNVDETIRMVEALQFFETHGEVCPAGWQKGKPGMKDTPEGVAEYLSKHADEL
ncbi:peroxiredoxin (alkyl hydroperoxide reductase subunit C) [Sulfurivirga caldicuralii]|uniref:Thioredoxin peroxidase n=1 Tax=Sulfurivirga caldicuralii TaxID=364032 RepID=A0A1N6F6Q6_9GAMM|nr:peroxiredoxin [Sulfurivirga caldicuralii]SIN90951.1 peroxiredoxin (alkyl hydroperoxide reductase subunit C) [Sulfurivirga caldicuralii]